jgi:hypothetical protein
MNLVGFLHIYRGIDEGKSTTTAYVPADGWTVRTVKRSAEIVRRLGSPAGNNWAVSVIDTEANPPTVQSKFINVRGFPPNLTVVLEDDGDAPYLKPEIPQVTGCCFLATATCNTLLLPDDCEQLETLRWFRDQHVLTSREGRTMVEEYYRIAPGIVEVIGKRPDAKELYQEVHDRWVRPAVNAIQLHNHEQAMAIFNEVVTESKRRFLAGGREVRG